MREIKFRAWNPEENKMFYPDSISFDSENGIGCLFQHHNLPKDTEIISGYSKCKLMQFTGLKDKNGVEIYEGDIVKAGGTMVFSNGRVKKGEQREIFFNESGFTGVRVGNEFDKKYPNSGDNWDNYTLWNVHEDLEVIGNIYANQKLLGKRHP